MEVFAGSNQGYKESRRHTHSTLEGEVVRSSGISIEPGISEDDSLCFQSTEPFRPWSK